MTTTPTNALILALDQATADGILHWRHVRGGHARVQGHLAALTLMTCAETPVLNVSDLATDHTAHLDAIIYPALNPLAQKAMAAASEARETTLWAATEMRHAAPPHPHHDPAGMNALINALSHATRRHALPWQRLSAPSVTCHTAAATGLQLHLTHPGTSPGDEPLCLSISQKGMPLLATAEPLKDGNRLTPIGELHTAIALANAETAREILESQPGDTPELIQDILASLI